MTSKAGSGKPLTVERGGETFEVVEAPGMFAVHRRSGGTPGELSAAQENPAAFPSLNFQQDQSLRDVEVYRVDAGTRDQAMDILRSSRKDVDWCAHLYFVPGAPDGLMVPTDRIYVEFEDGADPETINSMLADHGLELMPVSADEPDSFIVRLTSKSTQNPIKIASALRAHEEVKLAEPDFAMKVKHTAYRPADTLFARQWHLENRGGFGLTAGADVRAPDAWELTRGDRSIRICVMDDGVQTDHPDFASAGKIVAPHDFGQNDSNPNPVFSGDNHGTACAGVAVADENGSGTVGIAPGCALMPYRMSTMISDATIKELFDRARFDGADVISCSWGVNTAFFTLSTQMKKSIKRAATEGRGGRGCVIVFASGNENSLVNDPPRTRSGFAIHEDVIAVNASNSHDQRSHYSNFGPETWVCAPSSGLGGQRIVTTDRTGGAGYQSGGYTTVEGFGGTSSACPLVAGICGLMLSVNPNLTAEEVKDILRTTSDKIDRANGDYNEDGHSNTYGYGRVNALRAVREARDRFEPTMVRKVAYEAAPGLAIPDFPAAGVSDSIQVDDTATVLSVEVSLDIEHTYRGDLIVALVGPSGSVVTLHNRGGTFEDDLVATFSAADVPALNTLTAQSARGAWTLRVSDHAHRDTGTLKSWKLMLGLEGGARTAWQSEPGLVIPDNDPNGVVDEIDVEEAGPLTAIELGIDITHTYRGDLKVALESPSGVSASIHEQQGSAQNDLRRTYTNADTATLQAIVGGDIQGKWKLRVSDNAAQDRGKLNAWSLKLATGTA